MDIKVELQKPFTYSVVQLIVIGVLILICLAVIVWMTILQKRRINKEPQESVRIDIVKPKDIMAVKRGYIIRLNELEAQLTSNLISTRDAYKRMSVCIREFVFEVTGIEVLSCTLSDIRSLKMPLLEELIEEYYAPEFAGQSIGDAFASINKTKRAIEKWK